MNLPPNTEALDPRFDAASKNRMTTNTVTLCALAAIAFVAACVIHEFVGHGIACLAIGGKIKLLSSSFFRCSPSPVWVDAAGPCASLLAAAIAAGVLTQHKNGTMIRTFLALLVVFSGCWGSGLLIDSAVTDTGDMAFVLRGLALRPAWLWRIGMGILGLRLYIWVIRWSRDFLAPGKHLMQAYMVVLGVSCISALFFQGNILLAMRECLLEALASCGVVFFAVRRPSTHVHFPEIIDKKHAVTAVLVSALVVVSFWCVLGCGIGTVN